MKKLFLLFAVILISVLSVGCNLKAKTDFAIKNIKNDKNINTSLTDFIEAYNNKSFDYICTDLISITLKNKTTYQECQTNLDNIYNIQGKIINFDINKADTVITQNSYGYLFYFDIPAKSENYIDSRIRIELRTENDNLKIGNFETLSRK